MTIKTKKQLVRELKNLRNHPKLKPTLAEMARITGLKSYKIYYLINASH
jgi:hypothetical protein